MVKTGYLLGLLLSTPTWASIGLAQQDGNPTATPLHFDRMSPEVQVVRLVEPSVVSIQTNKLVEKGYFDLFGNWYRTNLGIRPYSQGSGVLIDSEGYLITNEHVIRGADEIKVIFNPKYDQTEYEAFLVNWDRESDLALLKISRPEPFPAVPIGNSDDLMIGERVIAIGNPFGEQNTVTSGIISAQGRNIVIEGRRVEGLLQTDASINPGNSGGPLLNINGELIGINNAIHPLAEGIGFAIPVDRVIQTLNEKLLNPNESHRIWIGTQIQKGNEPIIQSIDPGSPAETAGFREGDRIVAINGRAIHSTFAFAKKIFGMNPGDRLRIRVQRGRKEETLQLTLSSYANRVSMQKLGLFLEAVQIRGESALRVRQVLPGGPADRIRIQTGDLLWALVYRARDVFGFSRKKQLRLRDLGSLVEFLEKIPVGTILGIIIYRNGEKYEGEVSVR